MSDRSSADSMGDARLPDPYSPFPIPHIRAVTLELSQARIGVFDARATVAFLAERGVNTIVCFAVGYSRGEAYYPSAVTPEHPDLRGQDLFGEVMAACDERSIPVIAYVNGLFGGPEHYEPHPEWVQRWVDGRESVQGEAKMLCPNSPWRTQVAAVAAEVAARYPIAGFYLDEPSLQSWCACDFCRARYRADNGDELPLASEPGSDDFATFHDWRAGIVAGFVDDVRAAVLAARPGIAFVAQHAFPLASTALPHLRHLYGRTPGRYPPEWEGWYRPSFYGQDIARVAQSLDIVATEPWRRFVAQPSWWQGATVSYARSAGRGKPVLPLMEYPHFPWGQARLSDAELAVNCADAVANGGELWFAMYAPDAADRGGWDALREIFRELEGVRPAGMRQIAPAAVLASRQTAERFGRDDVETRYLDDLLGTVQLVRELQLPYKVLAEDALSAGDLDGVQALFVPSAACLTERTAGLARAFVAAGGALLATGWTGTHDARGAWRGTPTAADLLGLELTQETLQTGVGYLVAREGSGFAAGRKLPVRGELPVARLTSATTLLEVSPTGSMYAQPTDATAGPAVTRNRVGSGAVVWCGAPLGRLRRRYELFEARELLGAMLAATGVARAAIAGVDLEPEVALYAWQDEARLQLILVNGTSLDTTGRVAYLGPQTVRVDRALLPGSVVARAQRGAEVRVDAGGDEVLVTLAALREWECVTVEAGG